MFLIIFLFSIHFINATKEPRILVRSLFKTIKYSNANQEECTSLCQDGQNITLITSIGENIMLEFSVDPMSEGKQKLPRNFRFVKNYASTLPMKNFNYGNVREQMVENKLQLLIFNNEDKLELISISDDMHTPYYLTIIPKDIIIEDDYIMIPEKEVIIVDVDNLVDVYCLRRSKYSNMGSKMLVMTTNMEKIETQEDILKSLRGHIHVKYLIGNKIFCRSYTCRMSETVFFTRNITSSKKDDCYDDNIRRTVHEGHEQNVTIILIIVISLNIASVIYAVSLNYFIDTSEFEIAFKH